MKKALILAVLCSFALAACGTLDVSATKRKAAGEIPGASWENLDCPAWKYCVNDHDPAERDTQKK